MTTSIPHSSPLLALINDRWFVAYCNDAFREGFHIQPGQMLPHGIQSLMQMEIKSTTFLLAAQSSTFDYCVHSSREEHFRISLTHLQGSNVDQQTGIWLLQATPECHSHNNPSLSPQLETLSPRELEICHLVGKGLRDKQIASQLFISPHTVNQHFKSIHKKLKTHSRPELVSRLNRIHESKLPETERFHDAVRS